MYVAITRAKETCVITYAKTRFRNGQTKMSSPSRFLSEIDPAFTHSGNSGRDFGEDAAESRFHNPYASYMRSQPRETTQPPARRPIYTDDEKFGRLRPVTSRTTAPVKPQHTAAEVNEGMVIVHSKLGRGRIIKTGQISGEPSITVDFGATGIKNLLLKYAKFQIIND